MSIKLTLFRWPAGLLLAGVFASLATAPTTRSQSDWHQYQYNAQHIGYNPTSDITPPLILGWYRTLSKAPLSQATVAGGFVSVSTINAGPAQDSAGIWCLERSTGRVLWWMHPTSYHMGVMQASYGYGNLYVQTCDIDYNYILAVEPATGDIVWASTYRSQWVHALAPTIYESKVVLCGNTYGGMHAFDARNGDFLWKNVLKQETEYTPAVYGDEVYTYLDGYFVVSRAQNGSTLWTMVPGHGSPPAQSTSIFGPGNAPVVDTNSMIAYATSNDCVHAIDLDSHEVLWSRCGEYYDYRISPALYDGRLYAVQTGILKVYDGATGDSLGYFRGVENFWVWDEYEPVLANGYVFVSSRNWVHALDAESLEEVWRYNIGGHLSIAGHQLFVSTYDGRLFRFSGIATDIDSNVESSTVPRTVALHQNYPNPFNTSTVISYDLPVRSEVDIVVYNVLGRRVNTLVGGSQSAGTHSVEWGGTDSRGRQVSSGTYFYRIKAGEFIETKKMVVLK